MSAKRARRQRRLAAAKRRGAETARGLIPKTLRGKLDKARADRDRELGKTANEHQEQIAALYAQWADRRKSIWRAWEKRRDLILAEHRDAEKKEPSAA